MWTIVVKVALHTTITFCNTYIQPSSALHLRDLAHLETQLPKPFVIVGDFNSHNNLWGGNKTDAKGKVMETFMTSRNICLFNDDICIQQLVRFSSIDLTICSLHFSLILHWGWRKIFMAVTMHFPLVLESHYHPPDDRPPKWQFY